MTHPNQPAPDERVPFKPETWPVDADGFLPDLCTECGTPVRYGSRHSSCAKPLLESAHQPAPDEREAFIAWLTGEFPSAWPSHQCEFAWDRGHVAALSWRAGRAALAAGGGDAAGPWYENRVGALRKSPDACADGWVCAMWLDGVRYAAPSPAPAPAPAPGIPPDLIATLPDGRTATIPLDAPTAWPFLESPASVARRLQQALDRFGDLLAAVRHVLIEVPPARRAATPVEDEQLRQRLRTLSVGMGGDGDEPLTEIVETAIAQMAATAPWLPEGFRVEYCPPADYLTDEANESIRWTAVRTNPPYATGKGERVWTGPTVAAALEKACVALGLPQPQPRGGRL